MSGANQVPNKVYLFGSFKDSNKAADIDLLFVYRVLNFDSYRYALKFRELTSKLILSELGMSADIILLTEEEQVQVEFVSNENAILLVSS